MSDFKFPTEVVDLPSKGLVYPKSNPLSSGKVEMKYMTAREEDILTSVNLIKQCKALDKLLEALIVDKKIDYTDLLVGDKNALLVSESILAYGKNYDFNFVDSYGETLQRKADLTDLKEKKLDINEENKTFLDNRKRSMKLFMARNRNIFLSLAEAANYVAIRGPNADPSIRYHFDIISVLPL